jgi:chromosome segregation ATPase
LFRINDCEKYGLALQTIAGAGLRNIVVSTSDVATELFSQKAFNGFEKLMPIDRINGRIELAPTVKKIKQLTGDKAELALNLITTKRMKKFSQICLAPSSCVMTRRPLASCVTRTTELAASTVSLCRVTCTRRTVSCLEARRPNNSSSTRSTLTSGSSTASETIEDSLRKISRRCSALQSNFRSSSQSKRRVKQ